MINAWGIEIEVRVSILGNRSDVEKIIFASQVWSVVKRNPTRYDQINVSSFRNLI